MSNEPIGSPFPTGFHTNRTSIEAEPMVPPPPPPSPSPWRWSWSPFIGIKYGPVPVGLFVGISFILSMAAR